MKVNNLIISRLLLNYKSTNRLTFDKLAEMLDVSANTVKSIINDKKTPALETLVKICNLLKKDMNTFMEFEPGDGITVLQKEQNGKQDETNDYLVRRFEEYVIENTQLKMRLSKYEDVDDVAAEPNELYKKK
jgi:transcriptional regulator with XRE-family HTH domain